MTQIIYSSILSSTLAEIKASAPKATVVFDLDSTLFDVTPRLQRILHDFASDAGFKAQFPESCSILLQAEARPKDWGIKAALVRAGLDGHHPDFQKAITHFWRKCFFSNEYLHYDQPYAGAVDFVQKVAATGAQLIYLTGRDEPRQGKGSREVLAKWQMPLDQKQSRLVLKPQENLNDAQFKSDFFLTLPKDHRLWLFENEPVNINQIRRDHPEVKQIFVASTHAGIEEAPDDLPQIIHFLLD